MTLPWHTHVVIPDPQMVAVIAVQRPGDEKPWLLSELYYWCERSGCWMSESNHLKIKFDAFWWVAETDLTGTIQS